jgi:hypothetical protein
MSNAMIVDFMMQNMFYIVGGLGILVIIMYVVIINLYLHLSAMKKRYEIMMAGQDGKNIEQMLMQHIAETKVVAAENARIGAESKQMNALLKTAITKVGVVRFRAFEDMGSDLSYAVALLDSHKNGVVLSSIFGREDSRSYVKPIENGISKYTLSQEEEEAIGIAVNSEC